MMNSFFRLIALISLIFVFTSCGSGVRRADRPEPTTQPRTQEQPATSSTFNPVKTAQDMVDAKEYRQAVSFIGQTLNNPSLSASERESLWTLRLKSLEILNDINSLSVLKMSDRELSLITQRSELPAFRALAYLRLGESKLLERKQEEAREYFQKVVQEGEPAETLKRAEEYLKSLESLRKVEPKTIGVVLPLTGRYAHIAQRTLRGIQLGLGLNGRGHSSFRLAVVDSEGNPDLARRGIERLVQEDNVIAIIGGLLSRTAPAEASQASELGVPTVTLSLKGGVTELGPSVFRNSLTTEMQVRHLVRVAMEDYGYRKFAVLYPNDGYGVDAANYFWDEVLARGGQIVAAQVYSPKETDYQDVIRRLGSIFFTDARADEYRARVKELKEKEAKNKKAKSSRRADREQILPPIVDFDAIFIPDALKALGQLAATLAYNDIRSPRLLGTNLWNSPTVVKRSGLFANQLLFVDSFTANDNRFNSAPFVKEYRALFNEDPGLFEIQGYDSALMLRQLISQGASSRQTLSQSLARLENLPGLLAPLSVSDDREIQRPVVALTVENGQIVPAKKNR